MVKATTGSEQGPGQGLACPGHVGVPGVLEQWGLPVKPGCGGSADHRWGRFPHKHGHSYRKGRRRCSRHLETGWEELGAWEGTGSSLSGA